MKIPNNITVFGQNIDVTLIDTPEVLPNVGQILGRYTPAKQEITLYHNKDKPSIAQSNFIHETIEAIDLLGDLQLNHTQISTLSSALHQVLQDVYAEAA